MVQTGAWTLPDERPLPAELEAFLDACAPPVYVSFGSMPLRAAEEVARAVVELVRARGRRILPGPAGPDLALIDDQDDCLAVGEVNQQELFRRVAAVAGVIRTDGATVAAKLLLEAVAGER